MYQTLESASKFRTVLLKGPSGSGKTTKAAQFPAPVFFNFDNNLTGLNKLPENVRKGIRIVQPKISTVGTVHTAIPGPKVWDNFIKQLEFVSADPTVKTIVLDSITTMVESLFDKLLGTEDPAKRIEIQQWGDFQRYLKYLGEEVLCASDLDKHVIFIAHEQLERDEATQSFTLTLAIGGKMRTTFDLYFSDVWRTYTKTKGTEIEYWMRIVAGNNFTAKNSLVGIPNEFKWEDQRDAILKQL
jgi:hypothetical protein